MDPSTPPRLEARPRKPHFFGSQHALIPAGRVLASEFGAASMTFLFAFVDVQTRLLVRGQHVDRVAVANHLHSRVAAHLRTRIGGRILTTIIGELSRVGGLNERCSDDGTAATPASPLLLVPGGHVRMSSASLNPSRRRRVLTDDWRRNDRWRRCCDFRRHFRLPSPPNC